MKQFEINATQRDVFTKAAVKQLRREGNVPCVLYGNKMENVHFILNEKELGGLIYTPNSFIVALNFDGKKQLCVLYQAQFHPVNDHILHLDFLAVNENDPITIDVPVNISGHSEGVRQGGKLQVMVRKLRIKAKLNDLPDEVTVDISDLLIGKSIVAGDVKIDNVQVVTPKSTILCMVKVTRAAAADAPAEGAAEGAAPAAKA